jgi:hypothetical protein
MNFFKLRGCFSWRDQKTKFVDMSERIEKVRYMELKRDLLKIYPDMRKYFQLIEIKIGTEFKYEEAADFIYKRLFNNEFKDQPLIRKINFGFLCPNEHFKARVC